MLTSSILFVFLHFFQSPAHGDMHTNICSTSLESSPQTNLLISLLESLSDQEVFHEILDVLIESKAPLNPLTIIFTQLHLPTWGISYSESIEDLIKDEQVEWISIKKWAKEKRDKVTKEKRASDHDQETAFRFFPIQLVHQGAFSKDYRNDVAHDLTPFDMIEQGPRFWTRLAAPSWRNNETSRKIIQGYDPLTGKLVSYCLNDSKKGPLESSYLSIPLGDRVLVGKTLRHQPEKHEWDTYYLVDLRTEATTPFLEKNSLHSALSTQALHIAEYYYVLQLDQRGELRSWEFSSSSVSTHRKVDEVKTRLESKNVIYFSAQKVNNRYYFVIMTQDQVTLVEINSLGEIIDVQTVSVPPEWTVSRSGIPHVFFENDSSQLPTLITRVENKEGRYFQSISRFGNQPEFNILTGPEFETWAKETFDESRYKGFQWVRLNGVEHHLYVERGSDETNTLGLFNPIDGTSRKLFSEKGLTAVKSFHAPNGRTYAVISKSEKSTGWQKMLVVYDLQDEVEITRFEADTPFQSQFYIFEYLGDTYIHLRNREQTYSTYLLYKGSRNKTSTQKSD